MFPRFVPPPSKAASSSDALPKLQVQFTVAFSISFSLFEMESLYTALNVLELTNILLPLSPEC